jgi:hypothetical protein
MADAIACMAKAASMVVAPMAGTTSMAACCTFGHKLAEPKLLRVGFSDDSGQIRGTSTRGEALA